MYKANGHESAWLPALSGSECCVLRDLDCLTVVGVHEGWDMIIRVINIQKGERLDRCETRIEVHI